MLTTLTKPPARPVGSDTARAGAELFSDEAYTFASILSIALEHAQDQVILPSLHFWDSQYERMVPMTTNSSPSSSSAERSVLPPKLCAVLQRTSQAVVARRAQNAAFSRSTASSSLEQARVPGLKSQILGVRSADKGPDELNEGGTVQRPAPQTSLWGEPDPPELLHTDSLTGSRSNVSRVPPLYLRVCF